MPAVVLVIAAVAAADAVMNGGSGVAEEASEPTGTVVSGTATQPTPPVDFELSPDPRRCRERQLDLRSFSGEPNVVLAQVRGPDCRQRPIRIRVRITAATGARGKGTIFGPEPPEFAGVFRAGTTQVAAFRYSPACGGEGPPYVASITAGPYSVAYTLATVEPCGEVFPQGVDARCADASPEGPWSESCSGEWVRRFVRAAGFRIAGETGSAWIARGRGSSFYVWAVEITDSGGLSDEGYRRVTRLRGKGVYSDGIRFTWATASGRVWIESGPNADEPDPGRAVLAPLVRASLTLPRPSS